VCFDYFFGQFYFEFGWSAVARSASRGLLNRLDHFRMRVTQNHRSPRAYVVDILIAVRVDDVSSRSFAYEKRSAIYCAESADRAVDASRNQLEGTLKESG